MIDSPADNRLTILRPADLIRILGVSRPTLWRWRRDNVLPEPIQLASNSVGWRAVDIDRWLDERPKASAAGR